MIHRSIWKQPFKMYHIEHQGDNWTRLDRRDIEGRCTYTRWAHGEFTSRTPISRQDAAALLRNNRGRIMQLCGRTGLNDWKAMH